MPANGRNALRFYVDESALGLGKTLAAARRDAVHPGHPLVPQLPLGTLDVDWIPVVAGLGLVVIARDRRIRTKPAELLAFRDAGLRVLWIAGKRDLSTWDWLTRLVRQWRTIERTIDDRGPGPWFLAVNDNGLSEITI
jgi:hypothetical protein